MRRARCGAGDRAGKAPVDRAVQMAAQYALDLAVAGDHRGERCGVFQPEAIHVDRCRSQRAGDASSPGSAVGRAAECGRAKPGARRTSIPPCSTRDRACRAPIKPHRKTLDREMQKAVCRQVAVAAKRLAQRRRGHRDCRGSQRPACAAAPRARGNWRIPPLRRIDEIAGNDGHIGQRLQPVETRQQRAPGNRRYRPGYRGARRPGTI